MAGGDSSFLRQIYHPSHNLRTDFDEHTERLVWELLCVFKLFSDMHATRFGKLMPYRLDDKDALFKTLGFEPMSIGVQWQLITRLALLGVISGSVDHNSQLLELEEIYPEVQSFSELEPEITLDINTEEYAKLYAQLLEKYSTKNSTHVCRLIKSGSSLRLSIDGFEEEIRRFQQDTPADKLFNYLLLNKPNALVTRGELQNTDGYFIDKIDNLNSVIINSKLEAIRPFIKHASKDSILIQTETTLRTPDLESMIQKISEKFQKPFLLYLKDI